MMSRACGATWIRCRLLKSQLETRKRLGWYFPAEREERLFTNKSNRAGGDMKEALRTDGNIAVWQALTTTENQLRQLRQPALVSVITKPASSEGENERRFGRQVASYDW